MKVLLAQLLLFFFFLHLNNIFMSICTSHFVWCNIDKIDFFLDIQNFKKSCFYVCSIQILIIYKFTCADNTTNDSEEKNVAKLCHPFHKV